MKKKDGKLIKILLADDDEDDQDFFKEALEHTHANAKLTTVINGEKLMEYISKMDGQHPDIIFLDINMPRKNGKECLKEIRSNKKLDEVPVVILSTSSYKADIEQTYKDGANLYVSKPIFFKDKVKVLEKIIELHAEEELLKKDKKIFVLYALV